MLAGTYAEYGYERNFWQAYHQRRRRKDLNSKVSGCAKKPGNMRVNYDERNNLGDQVAGK